MSPSLRFAPYAAALAVAVWSPRVAHAHVGGVPASLRFVEPQGIVRAVADAVPVRWLDTDADPTAIFQFQYQPGGAPPFKVPQEPFFQGTKFAEAEEKDVANQLTWDVAGLGAGAYFVYAQSFDPPLCNLVHLAQAMVVVERAGQPRPLAALVVDPPLGNASADAEARVEIRAYGPARPQVTVRAGPLETQPAVADGGPCDSLRRTWRPAHDILTATPLDPDPTSGTDFWRGVLHWDTRNVAVGNYVIEVSATDDDGRTSTVYSAGAVAVWHPAATDGGATAPDGGPDAGLVTDGGSRPPPNGGGCDAAGAGTPAPLLLLLLGWIVGLGRGRTIK